MTIIKKPKKNDKFLKHGRGEGKGFKVMSCPIKPIKIMPAIPEHTFKGCVHWFDISGSADPKISSQKARPYIIISKDNPKSSRVIIS